MKKLLSLLLLIAMLVPLCACGNQTQGGNETDPGENTQFDSLQEDLEKALLLSDGSSLLHIADKEISVPENSVIPEYSMWPPNENDDPNHLNEWRIIAEESERHRQALEEDMQHHDRDWDDGRMEAYRQYLNQLDTGALGALSYIGTVVSRQFTVYCINNIINGVLAEFGIDTRSTDEKILEKLQILDDIYESVIKIENTVNEINQRLKDETYFSVMDERHTALKNLSYATGKKYIAVVKYLSSGYDEYLEKTKVFDTLIQKENYTNGTITDEYLATALAYSFDDEFYLTRAYMNGSESLLTYMEYMLMYHGDTVKGIIEDWAGQIIGGNTICIEIKNLLGSYGGGFSAEGMSFPEIYDYYAYRTYPWEHQGYAFREAIRTTDSAILSEAYAMANLYYALVAGNEDKNLVANTEREELWELVTAYNEIQAAHTVVHHDDYYICQIEGCEYVFAKTPIYFDYYSCFKQHLNGLEFEDSYDDVVNKETADALDALFYDAAIVYDYNALEENLKDAYTFDHSAIGEAAAPFEAIDWEKVSEFADTFDAYQLYLPQSAYKALFDYYKAKDKTVTSITAVLEKELGITFAENTNLVCDIVKQQNKVQSKAFSTVTYYYYNAFRLAQNDFVKNKDYMDITVCLKDDPSELKNKRFADKLNVKTTDCSPINGWGKASNRFGGLMVLGVQKSKTY